jgi:broad specificity phosphatase PhoE
MRSLERTFLIGVEGVTEIWLVRHGDVYDRLEDVSDPPLGHTGQEQARRLSERLKHLRIGAVYSSPHRRALETAQAITDRVEVDPRLVEATADFAGGILRVQEPPEAVIQRMQAAVDEAVTAHPGERVVLVGHGIAILNYLCYVLKLEPGTLRVFPACTSISVVRVKDGRHMVGSLCDVAHLEGMR